MNLYRDKDFNTFKKNAFLSLEKKDNVSSLFLDAIINLKIDDAKKYISKSLINFVDFNELQTFFKTSKIYKSFFHIPTKNEKCRTFFLKNEKSELNIIKIYMLLEPDIYSKFKIYAIIKEA